MDVFRGHYLFDHSYEASDLTSKLLTWTFSFKEQAALCPLAQFPKTKQMKHMGRVLPRDKIIVASGWISVSSGLVWTASMSKMDSEYGQAKLWNNPSFDFEI